MRLSDPRNLFLGPLLVLLFASCGGTDRAAYSVDAREWLPAKVKDGLLDGRKETLEIELPPKRAAQILLLRVRDAAFNVITFDLSTKLP